jgi:hypothetical protein
MKTFLPHIFRYSRTKYTRTACRWAALLVLVSSVAVAACAQQIEAAQSVNPAREITAAYQLNGQPTGTYREARTEEPGGGFNTSIETTLVFNRLGSKIEIQANSRYVESQSGQLKNVASDYSSSQQTTHMDVQVKDGALGITTTTGGKSYERTVDFTGSLLGPEGARKLLISRLHAPGDAVSYHTFAPEVGGLVTMSSTFVAEEDVVVGQHRVRCIKVEQTMSAMPGKSTLWLDEQGWLVRQTVPSPLGDIEAVRTEQDTEQKQEDSGHIEGATLPEETFTQSIVKANIRLPEERLVEAIKLKIIQKQPDLGWPDFEAENQHVLKKTPQYVVLEVRRIEPRIEDKTNGLRPTAKDLSTAKYLAPNALLQADDTNIEKIARSVAGNGGNAWQAAQALQRWTNDNMKFDPGIAVAPASEVARDRRGTCFGYAMLLGSLARAAGIPSRLRMGYVYAGGIWGGHAWIDVRIGDQWIPLDGALYSPGPADAARFSVFTSALEDGTLSGMGELARLFSHVDIKILEYTVKGRRVAVTENAEPYTIQGNTYRNQWLGLTIRKPSSYKFKDLDMGWPETTIAAMEGPAGQRVTVRDLSASLPTAEFDARKEFSEEGINGTRSETVVAGRKAMEESSEQKAELVVLPRGNVWAIIASGPGAKKLLEQVASTVALSHEAHFR